MARSLARPSLVAAGAFFCTCAFAFWLSGAVAGVKYLTCSVNDLGGPGQMMPFHSFQQARLQDPACIPPVFSKDAIELRPLKALAVRYLGTAVADVLVPWEVRPACQADWREKPRALIDRASLP